MSDNRKDELNRLEEQLFRTSRKMEDSIQPSPTLSVTVLRRIRQRENQKREIELFSSRFAFSCITLASLALLALVVNEGGAPELAEVVPIFAEAGVGGELGI